MQACISYHSDCRFKPSNHRCAEHQRCTSKSNLACAADLDQILAQSRHIASPFSSRSLTLQPYSHLYEMTNNLTSPLHELVAYLGLKLDIGHNLNLSCFFKMTFRLGPHIADQKSPSPPAFL